MSIPLGFPVLELPVLGRERSLAIGMLAPREGTVPSPRIGTTEIRELVDPVIVAEFAKVLHDRAEAGYRLKRLRMKDRETSLVPVEHKVNKLELSDDMGGWVELPEVCEMDLGER